MITAFDIITDPSDIVGGGTDNRWASAQPAGWVARRDGRGWQLSHNERVVGYCGNLDEVREGIQRDHNDAARGEMHLTAVAWRNYYEAHPGVANEEKEAQPEVYEALIKNATTHFGSE